MVWSQVCWLLTLAVALLAGVPAMAAQAPRLTIDELIKNGARYQNRVVQLRGQLDNCYGACSFCPEGTTRETLRDTLCLSLVFGPQVPGDLRLSRSANDLMTAMYRFAVVTIEARFTADCIFRDGKLVYANSARPGADEGICFSVGPVDLSFGRVLQVHARKTVLDGLIDTQWIYDELVPAEPGERTEMLAEFESTVGSINPEVFAVKDKQMAADFAVDGSNYDGVGCWCFEASCEGRWPTHLVFGMNSPASPFRCWLMRKTPNGWRVLPDN